MENRLRISKNILTDDGSTVVAIDKHEHNNLFPLLKQIYPNYDTVSVSIEHNKKGTQGDHFSFSNEYAIFVMPYDLKNLNRVEIPESDWEYSNLRNWGGESLREDAANCFYPIYIKENEIIGFGDVCDDEFHPGNPNIQRDDGIIEVYPIDDEGIERKWRYARQTVEQVKRYLKIDQSRKGNYQIKLAKATEQFKTIWYASKYNAGDYGTKILTGLGLGGEFDYPKSIYTVEDCIFAVSQQDDIILDYFAGSGTTAHATINLNRQDNGNRRYILIEMGEHFNTVIKPRIQKIIYSKDWKDGKPVSREGVSHIFKYLRLESYEDTLNNLSINITNEQLSLLEKNPELREQYLLSYMLNNETENSMSLLNTDMFKNPFEYKLKIANGLETKLTTVDLVETFNYLLGIEVIRNERKEQYNAVEDKNSDVPGAVKLSSSKEGLYVFKEIEGRNLDGEKILIIWRTLTDDIVKDNAALDAYFLKKKYSTQDFEFNRIYVNGNNNLQNLKFDEERWKVVLIEEEFKKLMFNLQDV